MAPYRAAAVRELLSVTNGACPDCLSRLEGREKIGDSRAIDNSDVVSAGGNGTFTEMDSRDVAAVAEPALVLQNKNSIAMILDQNKQCSLTQYHGTPSYCLCL